MSLDLRYRPASVIVLYDPSVFQKDQPNTAARILALFGILDSKYIGADAASGMNQMESALPDFAHRGSLGMAVLPEWRGW